MYSILKPLEIIDYFLLNLVDAKSCFAKNHLSLPGECHKNEPEKHSQKKYAGSCFVFWTN